MHTGTTDKGVTMWSYARAAYPITHKAGTVPARPLRPGDIVTWGGRHFEEIVAVSDSGLLQLVKANGHLGVMFRAPIEGDDSRSIFEIPVDKESK